MKKIRGNLKSLTKSEILLVIREIKRPEIDATLVAENIALQLTRRIAFRRAMKRAIFQAMKSGALGIKVSCSGRLGGAEMARNEWYIRGRVPLQTIRADLDYGTAEAQTTYGKIGIKVWIFKGELFKEKNAIGQGVEKNVNA